MWGLSLWTSESLTGFKKNSSAPSSKHLMNLRTKSKNLSLIDPTPRSPNYRYCSVSATRPDLSMIFLIFTCWSLLGHSQMTWWPPVCFSVMKTPAKSQSALPRLFLRGLSASDDRNDKFAETLLCCCWKLSQNYASNKELVNFMKSKRISVHSLNWEITLILMNSQKHVS